jgi:hypothetical protein
MGTFQENVDEYKKLLEKGTVRAAYKGLMEYIMGLRTYLQNKYPDHLTGSIYYGYMDMTYFPFTSKSLLDRKLKIAIVFIHDACRFEAWLSGYNKQVQMKYWNLIKDSGWDEYHLVPTIRGYDSILEHPLVAHPNFDDLDNLTGQIEQESLRFTRDVETFLAKS